MVVFQRKTAQSVHGKNIAKMESLKNSLADTMDRLQERSTELDSIFKQPGELNLKNDNIDEFLVSLRQDHDR